MDHILVMPMHDPTGLLYPHLERITPALKEVFSSAVISIAAEKPPPSLLADTFFQSFPVMSGVEVGIHFNSLYRHAARVCPPESVLHLCFADRLAFQVAGGYRDAFFASIRSLASESLPLIFQRSPAAWASHPRNYFEIESAITTVGRWVCGRSLDFAWCHLAIEAWRLGKILAKVRRSDMSMVAEIIIQVNREVKTADVDWLEWEDPFILGRNANELKIERENSLDETRKRLSYALPMMNALEKLAHDKPE
jgi:hypothetical protein